jgi:hypothetical protein
MLKSERKAVFAFRTYFGVNIFMGINELPGYKDYWSRDNFIGNDWIKSTFTIRNESLPVHLIIASLIEMFL